MASFNSYVSLPEGNNNGDKTGKKHQWRFFWMPNAKVSSLEKPEFIPLEKLRKLAIVSEPLADEDPNTQDLNSVLGI